MAKIQPRINMIIDNQKEEELIAAAKPLVKWLNENGHPHSKAIVETNRVELLEGICSNSITEFIKD